MKVEMDVPGSPSVIASPYGLCGRKATLNQLKSTHQTSGALCESRGGRPGLPVPNSPYGRCGRKVTLKRKKSLIFGLSGSRHVVWFVTNGEQKKLSCEVFNILATHARRVYDVNDADCWAQNGGTKDRN